MSVLCRRSGYQFKKREAGLGLQISSDFYFWVIVTVLVMISGELYFCVLVIAVVAV